MRSRMLLAVVLALLLATTLVGAAWANPGTPPGAGDSTDTGNVNSFLHTGLAGVYDIPAPNGQGFFNTPFFEDFVLPDDLLDGIQGPEHALANNPVCTAHAVFGDHD